MEYTESPVLPCAEKLAFDSKKQAWSTATVVDYRYGSKVHPYLCQYCQLWHLSSNTNYEAAD